ncbi:MAG: hypothetical protein LQ343_002408 [Gyalolechia ehrenbergii]|nr:MAG: hypothetical protein LQ343_002408 [Gyalolechia ehrenbergii]
MDSNQGVPNSQQPPSIDDIIEWQHEQSLCLGETGYNTRFPTADFFATTPIANAPARDFDDPDLLENAVEDFTTEYERVIHRMEYMKANKPLLIETENEVHRRLLKAGKTQQDIGRYISKGTSLRHKIDDLYDLQDRDSRSERNTLPALIYYGSVFNKRKTTINLPVDVSLAVFRDLVKVYLECIKDVNESLESIYYEDRPWKYQLKSTASSVQVDETVLPLEIEYDYTNLVRKMKSPGSSAFILVLTQEDWPGEKKTQRKRTQLYEEQNGNPPPDRMDDGIESLFDEVDFANDLAMFSRGQVQLADEEALEELARAAQDLDRERMDRDRAKRKQITPAPVSAHRHQLQWGSRGASQGQAASPPGKGYRGTPQSSPPASQSPTVSGGNRSPPPPRAHGIAAASSPTPSAPHSGPSTKKRVHFTKEKEQRTSTTKFFPSKK